MDNLLKQSVIRLKQHYDALDYQRLPWLLLSLFVVIGDQVSKAWALNNLPQHDGFMPILSWFNFTLVFNDGAAFSFLRGAGGWQRIFFVLFTCAVLVGLLIWLLQRSTPRLQCAALALVMGGAAGNLIDRLRLGHVVDFIHWHYHAWSWPVFNVADSAISIGIALMIIYAIFFEVD